MKERDRDKNESAVRLISLVFTSGICIGLVPFFILLAMNNPVAWIAVGIFAWSGVAAGGVSLWLFRDRGYLIVLKSDTTSHWK